MKDPYINERRNKGNWILGNIFISIMKTPMFAFMIVLHWIHVFVSEFLVFSWLKRFFIRASSVVCCGILRILSGLFNVQLNIVKKDENGKEKKVDFDDSCIEAGDIIIANYPSYVDLIYLQFKFTPVFFVPADDKTVFVKRFHQIFFESIFGEIKGMGAIENERAIEIATNTMNAPIILLPEAKKTNGTCLTKFNNFEIDFEKVKVFVAGIKHEERENVEPNYVSGSFMAHYVQTIGNISNSLEINFCSAEETPKPQNGMEEVRKCVSKLAGIPLYDDPNEGKVHVD